MSIHVPEIRVHNPNRGGRSKKSTQSKRATRTTNPLLALVGPTINSDRRQNGMAAKKKAKKSNPSRAASGGAKRGKGKKKTTNPFYGHKKMTGAKKTGTKRRKRNPPAFVKSAKDALVLGFWALVGLVIARQLPQMLLKEKNQGAMGYLANLATAVIAGILGAKTLGADAGTGLLIGGGLMVVNRVMTEKLSPVGQVLSITGLGDFQSLGEFSPEQYRPYPVVWRNGQPVIPPEIDARVAMADVNSLKARLAGMGHLSRGNRRLMAA